MTHTCPTCHAENREGAKFCKSCGGKLASPAASTSSVEASACSACGQPNKPGARFCLKCGASLLTTPPPPPP
ncbi:MAG: zinc ribbon domain-containing protein, partial [Burkholderiales bacterium]|nr:zinc ribbon domain-containing protein [Burkholderiales bacterium]